MDEMTFGERLAMIRKRNNMTQQQLAEVMGLHFTTIGLYEQGRRSPDKDMLQKLADYFDVTVDYLLGRRPLPQENEDLGEPLLVVVIDKNGVPVKEITPELMEKIKSYTNFLLKEEKKREK